MKKTIILLCVVAGFLSCTKQPTGPQDPVANRPMCFDIRVTETKADKTAWADGDKIYVFFNGMETKYLILERSGDSWTNTSGGGTLLDTDFSGHGTKTITAVHFPVAVDVSYADSKFSFTSGGQPVYNYYLFEIGKDYTVDGNTVSASISLGKPANFVLLHIAGIQATVADYTLGSAQIRPVACKSVRVDGTVTEEVLQAGARLGGVADSDGALFAGRLDNPSATNYTFSLASNEKIYTLSRTAGLTAGTMYNFPVLSNDRWSVQNSSDLYVDLGLSVKWAKCNVGTTSETEFGDYLSWGELRSKQSYLPDNYYFRSDSYWTKYCDDPEKGKDGYTDDLVTLEKVDDAAYAALGGKFRMPTYDEWMELLYTQNNPGYTWTWCDGTSVKYNGTNVAGVKIVKNTNGATLFLPAAGFWGGSLYVSGDPMDFFNQTHRCYYWSSSLKNTEKARTINSNSSNNFNPTDHQRTYGLSIRPVWKD